MKSKLTTIAMILLAAFITLGGTTSCKSKKRLAKEAAEAEYKSKVAEAIKDLNAILDDETLWTLEEKEARVQTIKNWNLQNAEVDDLLFQVERNWPANALRKTKRNAVPPKNANTHNRLTLCWKTTSAALPTPAAFRKPTVSSMKPWECLNRTTFQC